MIGQTSLSLSDRFARAVHSLSWERLTDQLAGWWHQLAASLTSATGQILLALCVGAAIGWITASKLWNYRWRRGSLILRDPRQPDTDFGEAAARVADLHHHGDIDRARAELVAAAADGLIGLWLPTRSGLLRRVPPRGLRRERGRMMLNRYDICRLVWSELSALLPDLAGTKLPSRAIVDGMATGSTPRGGNRPSPVILDL